jgi:hypothetical protein
MHFSVSLQLDRSIKRMAEYLPRKQFLREQIEEAKRLAAAMTNPRDRERFERIPSDYQREIGEIDEIASR